MSPTLCRNHVTSCSSLLLVVFLLNAEFSISFIQPQVVWQPSSDLKTKSTGTASVCREESVNEIGSKKKNDVARQVLPSALSSLFLSFSIVVASATAPASATAVADDIFSSEEVQGVAAVTQSDLGQSVRRSIVQGAKIADKLDLKWERFSDSLRDEKKCDPVTNRRLYDNGVRRDGTPRNAPVLGALCDPVPLKSLDVSSENSVMSIILGLADDAAREVLGEDRSMIQRKLDDTKELVGPAFARAAPNTEKTNKGKLLSEEEIEEKKKQQLYNLEVYSRTRTYGEILTTKNTAGRSGQRETARQFDVSWGQKMMSSLASGADRKDFKSPFPPPDPTEMPPYDEGALLDALGAVSVTLNKMQDGGLIGHWEISIPEDDYGEVVTIAVDDDVSIGAQILAREQNQLLIGSPVVAVVRSAMDDKAKISYDIDTFFIDPTTTKQELYNPTQLLISLSNLGSA